MLSLKFDKLKRYTNGQSIVVSAISLVQTRHWYRYSNPRIKKLSNMDWQQWRRGSNGIPHDFFIIHGKNTSPAYGLV